MQESADVSSDEGTTLGRRRKLDPVAVDKEPDAAVSQRDLQIAEAGVDRRAVGSGKGGDLAARQRLLGDEQQSLEGGLGQLDRLRGVRRFGRGVGVGGFLGIDVRHLRLIAGFGGHANDSRVSSRGASSRTSTPAAARSSAVVRRARIGPHGSV